MGWHLFFSVCLGIVGGLVAAAFGTTTNMAALIGLAVFLVYWGILVVWVNADDFF